MKHEFINIVTDLDYSQNWIINRIMEKSGKAYIQCYHFLDDLERFIISDLFVKEAVRKNKLGEGLILEAIEYSRRNNGKTVSLWVEKNSWKFEWYKRLGFIPTVPDENNPEDIWMELTL